MSGPAGDGDFERWLEAELRRTLAPAQGPRPRAAQAVYRQRRGSRRRATVMAMVAGAVAVCALMGEGVAALATGMPNPVDWSQRVVQVVHDCQDRADVGSCVGMLARRPDSAGQPGGSGGAVHASPSPTPNGAAGPSPALPGHIERAITNGEVTTAPGHSGQAHGDSEDGKPKHTGKVPKS